MLLGKVWVVTADTLRVPAAVSLLLALLLNIFYAGDLGYACASHSQSVPGFFYNLFVTIPGPDAYTATASDGSVTERCAPMLRFEQGSGQSLTQAWVVFEYLLAFYAFKPLLRRFSTLATGAIAACARRAPLRTRAHKTAARLLLGSFVLVGTLLAHLAWQDFNPCPLIPQMHAVPPPLGSPASVTPDWGGIRPHVPLLWVEGELNPGPLFTYAIRTANGSWVDRSQYNPSAMLPARDGLVCKVRATPATPASPALLLLLRSRRYHPAPAHTMPCPSLSTPRPSPPQPAR